MTTKLANFWSYCNIQSKETLVDRYIRFNANADIVKLVSLGSGSILGSVSEKYTRFVFPGLLSRFKNEKDYDHIFKCGRSIYKIEQKTSTKRKNNNFVWQHISIKHPWDLLLLMAIDYNEIKFYGMNRSVLNTLLEKKLITNQGSANKNSEQGLWFKYSDVNKYLYHVETTKDIELLLV
jgi:hypothetical protein